MKRMHMHMLTHFTLMHFIKKFFFFSKNLHFKAYIFSSSGNQNHDIASAMLHLLTYRKTEKNAEKNQHAYSKAIHYFRSNVLETLTRWSPDISSFSYSYFTCPYFRSLSTEVLKCEKIWYHPGVSALRIWPLFTPHSICSTACENKIPARNFKFVLVPYAASSDGKYSLYPFSQVGHADKGLRAKNITHFLWKHVFIYGRITSMFKK